MTIKICEMQPKRFLNTYSEVGMYGQKEREKIN